MKANDQGLNTGKISPTRAIFVASIGNALEWFDLIIFGFLSVVISKQFFPETDPTTSLMLTFATFGIAFVMRPLGGIYIGIFADKKGRIKALTLAAGLMMLGTGMIALMPTYHDIGIIATIGIVLARLIQGFSAGGEFASATAFLAEQSKARRGFFASWQIASQGLTTLLASGAGVMLTTMMAPEDLESWGWRLPFFFGMLIGPVALYIRYKVPETEEFVEAETTETPLRDTLRSQRRPLIIAIGATVLGTVSTFAVLYVPTFAVREYGIAAQSAFTATLATGIVQMILAPVVGHLGDKWGRHNIMIAAAVGMLLLIAPLYMWLAAVPTGTTLILVQIIFGVLLTGYFACQPAFLSDLFPVQTRTTGMSIGYNFAVTLFGGFAPFIITVLINTTGSKLSPALYIMFAAVVSLIALVSSRKTVQSFRRAEAAAR
ncbi:MFS transporter [Sphingobium subterraneum]|uniref:MHS family proline/betaine transporter-like MFS transporter n=1 Tax=Sphingobium subterraneum TaxID=627688 RepID=A0A841IYE4_9SPHN|nr:MFS transporter [Sphingobium subterraneum]MBB6123434.1 MHS family proline/betaine transporter-like MFS transporter [Sphingobium subterraneum]